MEQQRLTLKSFEELIRQEKPVVVDFWAIWSTACVMYKEKLRDAHKLLEKYASFGSVDIERVPELAEQFSIITIPTTMIFLKGQIVKQYMGIQEPEALQAAIEEITGIKIEQPKKKNSDEPDDETTP